MPWKKAVLTAAAIGLQTPARSEVAPLQPCRVADVATHDVQAALERASRPNSAPVRDVARRWAALVPTRIWIGGHEGTRASIGWTDSLTGPADRWQQFADRAVTARIEWDLRDLVRAPPPPPAVTTEQRLDLALKTEQLAMRTAEALRTLRRAQGVAAATFAGEPVCRDAQADAEAAALILRTVIAQGR